MKFLIKLAGSLVFAPTLAVVIIGAASHGALASNSQPKENRAHCARIALGQASTEAAPQESVSPKQVSGDAQREIPLNDRFEALSNAFAEARLAHAGQVHDAFLAHEASGKSLESFEPAPSIVPDWFPRFEALAAEGSLGAKVWLLQFMTERPGPPLPIKKQTRAFLGVLALDLEEATLDRVAVAIQKLGYAVLDGPLNGLVARLQPPFALLEVVQSLASGDELRARTLWLRGDLYAHAADSEEVRARKLTWFQRAASEYPATEYGRRAAGAVFRAERLQIGMPAPNLAGQTHAGEPLRLDELLGRVVVVDFWGYWCAPCVAELPKLKAMLAAQEGRPLTVLGVNSDERDTFEQLREATGVSWPNLDDASTEPSLSTRWGVRAWPTIFVIDHRGVIRHVGLRGEELASAVAKLLDEI